MHTAYIYAVMHITLDTHFRLVLAGFLLLYFAALGGLVVVMMPALDAFRAPILLYFLLPVAVVGAVITAFENMQPASKIWPGSDGSMGR